jgi:hypothetical protein
MIKLVELLKEITEGKQVGDVYHFTSMDNLKKILKSKILIPSKERKYISFTRNKNLATLENEKRDVKITIDGNKLSTKYKIIPYTQTSPETKFDDYLFKRNPNIFKKSDESFEAEVIIPVEKYNNKIDILPYIKQIDITDYNFIKDRPLNNTEKKEFKKYNIPINFIEYIY